MRHILIRRGFKCGEIIVVLVISSIFPAKRVFTCALINLHPEITTLIVNTNSTSTNLLLGTRDEVIFDPGTIKDTLCNLKFRISSCSFYQINTIQTEILYKTAVDFAGLTRKQTVVDAYCVIRTIGLIASGHAKSVLGVETNRKVIRDAKYNASINGIKKRAFFCERYRKVFRRYGIKRSFCRRGVY